MNRRDFLKQGVLATAAWAAWPAGLRAAEENPGGLDKALAQDWFNRWEKFIANDAVNRYCDREMGEEIGWIVSPFLEGYYYGYRVTRDAQWVERFADWADAWIRRGVVEPDGHIGWPKNDSAVRRDETFYMDSLLGEAMAMRPLVLMADEIQKSPPLKARHYSRAEGWLKLAKRTHEKWMARGCWRETKKGGLWVMPAFGVNGKTGKWTDGYARRHTDGFSLPANKQNLIARWLIAMHVVTKKSVYKDQAEQWWKLMKSRLQTPEKTNYLVWNYWDPAGSWDFGSDGLARHWVGVHGNGTYYAIDVEGMVTAYEHKLVFEAEDIKRLIATNRDFMWNHQVKGAQFRRIDGGQPDPRWKDTPGVLWTALTPYDETLRNVFLANHEPGSWTGLAVTPWFLQRAEAGFGKLA
jgi:hypothetical protein